MFHGEMISEVILRGETIIVNKIILLFTFNFKKLRVSITVRSPLLYIKERTYNLFLILRRSCKYTLTTPNNYSAEYCYIKINVALTIM